MSHNYLGHNAQPVLQQRDPPREVELCACMHACVCASVRACSCANGSVRTEMSTSPMQ